MLISRLCVVLIVGTLVSSAKAQTLESPPPPAFPADQDLLSSDPSLSPAPQRPQPTEAFPSNMVHEQSESGELPNQGELVSILKRKLPKADQTMAVKDAPEWFQTLMQRIVRENVPDKYVRDKDWGKTDRRWDGVQLKRRGTLQWSTKRKWKEVNHGTWKRYEITQIDPQQNLTMRIENVRDAGAGKVGFDVRLNSKLHVFGRLAKWTKGVQVYNVSADADARVEMQIHCEVGMKLDIRKFPPDVVMAPQVTRADLDVTDFRLQKVSKLRGPLVRELSGSVRRILMDKIEEKRDKLPEKINRQIAKNQDKMRLSLSDFASSKWNELTSGSAETPAKIQTSAKPKSAVQPDAREPSLQVAKPIVAAEPGIQLNAPQESTRTKHTAVESMSEEVLERVNLLDLSPIK